MSDLDDEELKATKRLNLVEKVKECAKNTTREDIIEVVEKLGIEKEKSADEMFEELGYKIKYSISNNEVILIGYYKESNEISIEQCAIIFLKKARMITTNIVIDMQELQAINKKCKELGWIDE